MASFFEQKDRRMIPNWRRFDRSLKLGELNSLLVGATSNSPTLTIDEYLWAFKSDCTIATASDLISAAIVNNFIGNPLVKEAAEFIKANRKSATDLQLSSVDKILLSEEKTDIDSIFNDITIEGLNGLINRETVFKKIAEVKKQISFYPFNAMDYVELSRLYSVAGVEEKAIRAMKTALHLSPENRFVIRSATRLFVHYNTKNNDYLNYIHYVLKKNLYTSHDPWLLSAEISIATTRGQSSKLIKDGVSLLKSKKIAPLNLTELASSLATVELLNGNTKKSKEFFNLALIHPNDNSLAQIEWASKKDIKLNVDLKSFAVQLNFEALALESFNNEDYSDAVANSVRWFADMPFSKRPIIFGSSIASTIIRDQPKAISFLKLGLLSHPSDPWLINNLSYSLSLNNQSHEALELLNKIKPDSVFDKSLEICLFATRGLALFRSGYLESGRKFYHDAIQKATDLRNSTLAWIAVLNYSREELLIRSQYVENIMNIVAKIPENINDIDIKFLKEDVMVLYEKYKSDSVMKK